MFVSGYCNFEKDFCGWTNSVTDQFDWIRNKGATGSSGTGPTNDHTLGTRGTGKVFFLALRLLKQALQAMVKKIE